MKKIALFCLLLITTLISGCIQTSLNPIHLTPAPPMSHLNLINISPNPAPEGTKVPIIVNLLSYKGEPMPNELIYINLSRTIENRIVNDNIVTVTYNRTVEPYQIYTDIYGNAILNYTLPSLPSYKSCDIILISILWKNSTNYGSISTEERLTVYTTRPTYSIQSFALNPIIYLSRENEAFIMTTIISRTEGGNLYNLGPINFEITQDNDTNYLTAYTNCAGQSEVTFKPKPGLMTVKATYQNFSDTANTTIPSS
jgi:hypothetical protein